jgi:hypothetical protein
MQPWAVLGAGVTPLAGNKNSKLPEKANGRMTSAVFDKAEGTQSESSMSGDRS